MIKGDVEPSFLGSTEFNSEMDTLFSRTNQGGMFDDFQVEPAPECFKVAAVGQKGVGKTTTILNLCGREVPHKHMETLGMQVYDSHIVLKLASGKLCPVKLEFWDSGFTNSQQFGYIKTETQTKADCMMYVCSSWNVNSFKFIERKIRDHASEPFVKVVVVTGFDALLQREVCEDDLQRLAVEFGVKVCKIGNLPLSSTPFYKKRGVVNILDVLATDMLAARASK